MISKAAITLCLSLLACIASHAQEGTAGILTQVQLHPDGDLEFHMGVDFAGTAQSPEAVGEYGSRFELWSVYPLPDGVTLEEVLLAGSFADASVPAVQGVKILSEDPFPDYPRTRVDKPFRVEVTVVGIRDVSRPIEFNQHTKTYGAGGDEASDSPDPEELIVMQSIKTNGTHAFHYPPLPHAEPLTPHFVTGWVGSLEQQYKARGEQRFEIIALPDAETGQVREILAESKIQIWPVATGTLAGLTNNQQIKFRMPQLTMSVTDLYPKSTTYIQAYPGAPLLGTVGRVVPGSAVVLDQAVPADRIILVDDYNEVVDANGQWTFELVTSTPFGIDRLAYVTIHVDRALTANGTFTTLE